MFFYSRKQPTFCFTFFLLWLQFNYNLQITLNFISFSQGFSFQIGYCEVDDQLPGRSIPQYTLYLTVANEKERLDWIRALRAGELKEHWREITKKFLKWKFLKCVICKHFIKLNKKRRIQYAMHRIFANLLCPLKMELSLYEYSKDIFILLSVALAVISKKFPLEELVKTKKKMCHVYTKPSCTYF